MKTFDWNRDKRALVVLGAAVLAALAIYFWPADGAAPAIVAPVASVESSEQRLAHLRETVAGLPARQEQLEALRKELEGWESGLVRTETAQQAQAELLQVLRRLAGSQTPPVEFRSTAMDQVRPLGASGEYGEALVSVSFNCAIEQLVNLLAELTAQEQAVATEEVRIDSVDPQKKMLDVRLTVAVLVPRTLVPERKGIGSF